MDFPLPAEDYITCLTPRGAGAIASLGLQGPHAWQTLRELFQPFGTSGLPLPAQPEAGRIWLGRLGEEVTDQVVVTVPGKEPVVWLEVHCHGGLEVSRLIQEVFGRRGFQTCSWQQFHRLASGNLLRSEALAALAEARTARTAAILLDQYQGACERGIAAVIRAWDRNEHSEEAGRLLEDMARYVAVGGHLTQPWRVVVAGPPNVGKSSLVNALAGYQRCIAADTPGTTRDLVTTTLGIDGWLVELVDTAGVREATGELEEKGIRLAREAASRADLCLWVLDASAAPHRPDLESRRMRVVINKVDLAAAWDLDQAGDAVRVSARTGAGLKDLCQALSQMLVPDPPTAGAAVPFTTELCALVERSRDAWIAGRTKDSRAALESAAMGLFHPGLAATVANEVASRSDRSNALNARSQGRNR
jgi:tRNA modification GTPase